MNINRENSDAEMGEPLTGSQDGNYKCDKNDCKIEGMDHLTATWLSNGNGVPVVAISRGLPVQYTYNE